MKENNSKHSIAVLIIIAAVIISIFLPETELQHSAHDSVVNTLYSIERAVGY